MARRKGFPVVGGEVVDPAPVERPTFADRQVPADRAEEVCDALLALSPELTEAVPLSHIVREALAAAREVRTHGARRRQRLYVAKLLRAEDLEAVEAALEGELVEPAAAWRDRLLEEGGEAIEALLEAHDRTHDGQARQQLRQLVRQVSKGAPTRRERARDSLLDAVRGIVSGANT